MEFNEIMTSENDKRMLLVGLARVIYADGKVTETELEFFSRLSTALNIQNADIDKLKDQKVSFDKTTSSMFFLTQAIQVCYVDGSYDESEKNELIKICQELDISENALEEVEKWVEEGIEWNNRGMKLLELK